MERGEEEGRDLWARLDFWDVVLGKLGGTEVMPDTFFPSPSARCSGCANVLHCRSMDWSFLQNTSLLWGSSNDLIRIHMVLSIPQGAPLSDRDCNWAYPDSHCPQHLYFPNMSTSSLEHSPTQSVASQKCPKHTYIPLSSPNTFETCPLLSLPEVYCWNLFIPCLEVTIQEQCKNIFKSDRNPVQINSINSSE